MTKKPFHHSNNPEKGQVILLGPAGISAVNINGTTTYFGSGITSHDKYNKVGHKQEAYPRNKLHELKALIIDKTLMISSGLFLSGSLKAY